MQDQPREQNGQYGFKNQSYPEVAPLAEEVDGSFLFPPNEWPGGVQQYLEFWRTQPISDDALTNFVSAYAADWDEWAEPIVQDHLHMWGNSREGYELTKRTTTADELRKARLAEMDRFIAELEHTRPRRIKSGLARHVARAAQIVQNSSSLRTDEDREVAGKAVMYHNADGEPWTAGELWDRYHLREIMPDAFYARENKLEERLRVLTETLLDR